MSHDNRIWFAGNPWPEGHPIKNCEWTAKVRDGVVWLRLHLESADYNSEREIDDENAEHESEWESPVLWTNYHSCTMSATKWHDGGWPFCPVEQWSLGLLDGHEANVNPLPESAEMDFDDLAFHIYLLGHDAVAGHKIRFTRRSDSDRFDIEWFGKVALAYSGEDEYRYEFRARIHDVPGPSIPS